MANNTSFSDISTIPSPLITHIYHNYSKPETVHPKSPWFVHHVSHHIYHKPEDKKYSPFITHISSLISHTSEPPWFIHHVDH